MNILMAGDCVGRAGRKVVAETLAGIRREYALDLVILNVENAAAGFSITPSTAQELFAAGVDVMTSGNHIFDKKDALELIQQEPRLLRPVNYVPTLPGSGVWTDEVNSIPVAVVNVQGR
ncbi:MAG TPA: YmdB family metallophosphoesterase, partial [Blastocatellia bacterium]|nr:YmdB family metallophosphoesterase [Blastocatellia bacterium]